MQMRKTGYIYSPEHTARHRLGHSRELFGAVRRGMPTSSSLERYVAKVYDQDPTSCCVGFAFARLAHVLAWRQLSDALGQTAPAPPWYAPLAAYTLARAEDRLQRGVEPSAEPLVDAGCIPALAAAALADWGLPPDAAWPFDPVHVNDEPDLARIEAASACDVHGYYTIDSVGEDRLAAVRQAISEGYGVGVGIQADDAFMSYQGGSLVTAWDPAVKDRGHMVALVGYGSDDSFRGVNSWGTTWGDGGMFGADASWVLACQELFVLTGAAK